MSHAPLRLVAVLALGAAIGCGSSATTSTNLTSPSGVRCQATVNNSSSNFGATGGTGSITVSVSRECSWSAAPQAPWIAITSARDGQGDGTITYRVDANGEPIARQGALAVADRQVAIGQAAAPCQFAVAVADSSVPPDGGTMNVDVRTHAACRWTAASEVSWASVSPASAQGAGVARVNVAPNATPSARAIAVTVAGQRITATQPAVTAPAPPPSPGPGPTPGPPPAPPAPGPADPTPVSSIKLEGPVASVSGSCPLITFSLRDRVVYTTPATDIKSGPCKDIRNGRDVKVEGMLMSDGRVRASKIDIGKDNDFGIY